MEINKHISLIFPAFITGFTGKETETLMKCGGGFDELLQQAAAHTGLPLDAFDIDHNNFLDDELKTQYITYVFSCAFADMLKHRGVVAHHGAGYSMGIYAALYYAGSLSFTAGLDLIRLAFACIRANLSPGEYAMGVTGGLEESDIQALLGRFGNNTVIINTNSPFSFVFSGPRAEITAIVDASREEGALQSRVMGVSIPYHSPHLRKASECFGLALEGFPLLPPEKLLASAVDQRPLDSVAAITSELVHNLHLPFNWYKTIRYLNAGGTGVFIECGAGESLSKINKFIEGDFRTFNLKNIIPFLGEKM